MAVVRLRAALLSLLIIIISLKEGPMEPLASRQMTTYERQIWQLWQTAKIDPRDRNAVEVVSDKIIVNWQRYSELTRLTGVPEVLIGAIHFRECSFRFDCHLINGDCLTARTVREPRGLPLAGHPP